LFATNTIKEESDTCNMMVTSPSGRKYQPS